MSYTKQNWNTGDVITADKLNHMEDGITFAQVYIESEAVRFSDSVTMEERDGIYRAPIDCDLSDEPEQIKVTFDGTEYTCEKISGNPTYYGGIGSDGPDFSEYPFVILANNPSFIFIETGGTHQVEITATAESVNEDLEDVINSKVMVIDFASNGSIPIPEVEDVIAAAEKGASITYRRITYDNNGDILKYSYSYNVNVFPNGGVVGFFVDSTDCTHGSTGITTGK